jgi:tRNA(fMet)-specific endonuclease VapC
MGLIVDSTALVGAERRRMTVLETLNSIGEQFGDEELALSVMTAAELVHGIWRAQDPQTRARREEFVEEVFARLPVRPVTLRMARLAGQIDAGCRARGVTIPTADLYIGVTALDLDFRVLTANTRHFRQIPGLKLANLR